MLESCNEALKCDSKNVKALFRKAKALMRLLQFEESEKILSNLELKEAKREIENVALIKKQISGDYKDFAGNEERYISEQILMNYAQKITIKMTDDIGRGVFAS